MKWRWWRNAQEQAEDFSKNRGEQADEQFITACGLPDTPEATRIALAVRRSVARYGMVDAKYIRVEDRYPDDLSTLSGWDSIDFLAWVFELERELGGEKIPKRAFDRIRQPFAVKDLILAVYHYRQNAALP